ncbi:MAG: hypothetical protein D6741_01065 [Planctomycetota bacterium]|nr:MAG: hypothetical protein D6741_01065 [Planctomycetota bacterium]
MNLQRFVGLRPCFRRHERQRAGGARTAFALIAVIATTAVIGALLMITAKQTASLLREVRTDSVQVEAEVLRDSAFELAAAKLRERPSYTGETWQPTLPAPFEGWTAVVVVDVRPTESPRNGATVEVDVQLGRDSRNLVSLHDKRSIEATFDSEASR